MSPTVAIIGAGLAGCLTALELSKKGISTEIFERNTEPLSEASYFNEGKVHLGFLYAHDSTGETSRLMVEGATHFRRIVSDLTGFDVAEALSTPFLYAVHKDSLVTAEEFEKHLTRCSDEFSLSSSRPPTSLGYVNGSTTVGFQRLERSEWEQDLDPEVFSAVFRTDEYGVDPRVLARAVAQAVEECSDITLHTGVRVEKVAAGSHGRWSLRDSYDRLLGSGEYDVVLNASWSDLLRIDQQMGIPLPEEWSYRYKLGNRVLRSVTPDDLSSVTVVLGAFGDIVNYGPKGGVFLSWYPSGRLLMTDEVDLPDWNGPEFAKKRDDAFLASQRTWEAMSTKLKALGVDSSEVDTRGGMILATGRLDVDDPTSLLHSRVKVGLTQRASYFSLNTGKYTLAPLMSVRAADAVEAHLFLNR